MGRSAAGLVGFAGLDRVRLGVLAPFEPAAVVDGGVWPAHELGVEPGFACAPACAAVEGDPFVWADAGVVPVGCDFGVWAHGVVEVAVVLHVVGVAAAVAPDIAGDPPGGADVVVAGAFADVFVP